MNKNDKILNLSAVKMIKKGYDKMIKLTPIKFIKCCIGIFAGICLGGKSLSILVTWAFYRSKENIMVSIHIGKASDKFTFYTAIVIIIVISFLYFFAKKQNFKDKKIKTWVVFFEARIGLDLPMINYDEACKALQDNIEPNSGSPFYLNAERPPNEIENFGEVEKNMLDRRVHELLCSMSNTKEMHVSLFAIAPMPLLVYLGTRLNEKYQVDVYQLHRNAQRWKWADGRGERFIVNKPTYTNKQSILVFSISESITNRVKALYGGEASIWEVTTSSPNMDMLRSKEQLFEFRELIRELLSEISRTNNSSEIKVHMAMPIACAVELGRVWMPKAHKPLVLFDYNHNRENEVLTIK